LSVRQVDVEIQSGDDVCRAWFFFPVARNDSSACIVMGHGLGLTRHCGLREIAVAFATAGYAVLLFDYRGFGDSGGEPRQLISFRKQLVDWAAAIDYARSQEEVDANRIFTWGFSLGAGHALTAAARDEGVAAVVAVAPMFDGLGSTLAAMKRWGPLNFLRIIGRATKDLLGSFFGRSPTLVPLTALPGDLGLLTSPDAHPGYRALVPSDFNYDTAARIGLVFWSYFPGLRLRRFSRPILILPSSVDRINPPGPTLRHASKCKSATIIELDCEHLEAVVEPTRSRVVRATLDFLNQRAPSRQVQ
jgi:alpha-beta hydrolase superfamily lysophospholipase